MAIPAGGAPEPGLDTLAQWVTVRAPGSLATSRMQRGAYDRYWASRGFVIVAVFPVIPEGG